MSVLSLFFGFMSVVHIEYSSKIEIFSMQITLFWMLGMRYWVKYVVLAKIEQFWFNPNRMLKELIFGNSGLHIRIFEGVQIWLVAKATNLSSKAIVCQ